MLVSFDAQFVFGLYVLLEPMISLFANQ